MEITNITAQKRKGRYNVFIDGSFFSGIDGESLIKSGLKVGQTVDKQQLEKLVIETELRSAFDKVLGLISRCLYSKQTVKQKLEKYGYSQQCIANAIKKAEEYGYINDKEYAKALVESKTLKSKMEIKQALFQKGICSNISNEATDVIDEKEEKQRALTIATKYMKNKEVNKKNMANLYTYLSRRGFVGSSVNYVLNYFKFDQDIND